MARAVTRRFGVIAMANFPIIFATFGRNNMITIVTGISYQEIRFYHKVLGRIAAIETLVHVFGQIGYVSRRSQSMCSVMPLISSTNPARCLSGSTCAAARVWKRLFEIWNRSGLLSLPPLVRAESNQSEAIRVRWLWECCSYPDWDRFEREAMSGFLFCISQEPSCCWSHFSIVSLCSWVSWGLFR